MAAPQYNGVIIVLVKTLGEKLMKADADFAREATGLAIGGIPSAGHTQIIETYTDPAISTFDIGNLDFYDRKIRHLR